MQSMTGQMIKLEETRNNKVQPAVRIVNIMSVKSDVSSGSLKTVFVADNSDEKEENDEPNPTDQENEDLNTTKTNSTSSLPTEFDMFATSVSTQEEDKPKSDTTNPTPTQT